MGALQQLREAGKIAHVGLNNVSVEQIQEAQSLVEVVSVQNRCNIIDRSAALRQGCGLLRGAANRLFTLLSGGRAGQKEALGSHPAPH